jgi:hypothetical protein
MMAALHVLNDCKRFFSDSQVLLWALAFPRCECRMGAPKKVQWKQVRSDTRDLRDCSAGRFDERPNGGVYSR